MSENRGERVLAMFDQFSSIPKKLHDTLDKRITIWTSHNDYRLMRNFNTIIFAPKSSTLLTSDKSVLEKELLRALEEGAHVCMLCDEESEKDALVRAMLLAVGSRIIYFSDKISEIDTRQPEFREFIKNYGIASNVFEINSPYESVICTMRHVLSNSEIQKIITKYQNDDAIVGFTMKKYKGLLTFLPFHLVQDTFGTEKISAVLELAKALETHRKNIIFEAPKWIDAVNTKMEEELKGEISKLNDQARIKQGVLDDQFNLKSILWLKHGQLEEKCIAVLNAMGIKTRKEDNREEDFWILDSNESAIVICECKGKDNNLTRSDINDLDTHKEAREKGRKFPGLLIVNNFNKAKSVTEKDTPLPPNVIDHAVNMNVLVLRTLDLYHLLDLHQRKIVSTEKIISNLLTLNGWMKVTNDINVLTE